MRDVLASLPAAAAYLTGPELVVEFANSACRELIGGRDVVGLPLREALPELAAQERIEKLRRVLAAGEPAPEDVTGVQVSRGGGQAGQVFADFAFQPVPGAHGAAAGILMCAADVTGRVRDERQIEALNRELTLAEARYRTLFAAMPQGVIHYGADGAIIDVNPAACEILGRDPADMTAWPMIPDGQAVHEDGTPFRPQDLPMRAALERGEIIGGVVAGVPHGRTGEVRWLQITAVPAVRDYQGRPRRAYVIFTDLTEQRRMEAALRESTGLLGQLRESNVLGVVASTERGAYDANDAFLDMIGYSRDDLAAGRISYRSITPPDWAGRDRDAVEQLRRSGAFQPYDKEYLHRDGHRVPVMVGGATVDQQPLRWVTFVVDLTARQRAEKERSDLHNRERAARAQAEYARERLTFLLRAGSMVAATRDRHELLEHAAQLVVPALADHCVVFLPAPDGALHATSLAHVDPARAPVLAEFRQHTIPAAGPMNIQAAFTTGTSQLMHDVDVQLSKWHDLAPGLVEVLARLRAGSVLATPLMVDGRPAGVLALARDAQRSGFASTDIEVVEEFARRMSAGMAAADTFAREHTIAETLQRALLPGVLPEIAGLDLAVSYLPASDGVHVGGDWYDAFPLADGSIGLVIGDVTGHNIASASIMGQVRSLLRAYALDHQGPAEVLRRTNDALSWLLPDALATAVYAVLDPATGELTYASAGHPPPLASTGAGGFEYLDDAPGTILGALPGAAQRAGHRRLPPGGKLLFYTDGLIEDRYRDISDGLSTLSATLTRAPASTAAGICAAAEQVLSSAPTRADDVCLLAIQLPRAVGTPP
jgi:PAS domain S-box-containing protein